MLPYKTYQHINLGVIELHTWGIMVALGFLTTLFLTIREAKKTGLDYKEYYNIAFYILLGGLIGSRLGYVFFYWPEGVERTFLEFFAVWKGGVAFLGALVGAVVAVVAYTRKKKLNFLRYADTVALYAPIGHAIGRVGCYLTGLHIGKETTMPWGIMVDNEIRHPVILYSIAGLLLVYLFLRKIKKYKKFNGFLFFSYLMSYSVMRFIVDFFRDEITDPRFYGLTPTQYGLIAVFIGAVYFVKKKRSEAK